MPEVNWLPDPELPFVDAGLRLEHSACMSALRIAKRNAAQICRASGMSGPKAKLTFPILMHYADFPVRPAISTEPIDDATTLLTKFSKTRTARAWYEAWSMRPDCRPGLRFMVIRGPALGVVMVHDGHVPDDRAHILVIDSDTGDRLVLEPFKAWVAALEWAAVTDLGERDRNWSMD